MRRKNRKIRRHWKSIGKIPALPVTISPLTLSLFDHMTLGLVEGVARWALQKFGYLGVSSHPEAVEPITVKFDERQEGRSEVVRAIAKPREN